MGWRAILALDMRAAALFPPSDMPPILHAADFPKGPPVGPEVCGLDEAGRGPLAGPVYAACVVLPQDFPIGCLGDSKALTAKRREEAFAVVMEKALAWAIDWSSPAEIDELNILGASLLSMRRAYSGCVAQLGRHPAAAYVDGNRDPRLERPADFAAAGGEGSYLVVKGDAIVPAIMAASILAKVARDRMMERWDWLYPEYGYAKHKGYPTAEHRAACRRLGPSPLQRMSFHCD
jgi:ribonuclease HII